MFARTERLLLRPAWAEDTDALFRAIGDERVVRNLAKAPWPYQPEHAERFVATQRPANRPSALIFLRTCEAPLASRAARNAPTRPSIMSDGATMSAPAFACEIACFTSAATVSSFIT